MSVDVSRGLRAGDRPAFGSEGLVGYAFGPLKDPELEVHRINVYSGHAEVIVSTRITRLYYILSGRGRFLIGDEKVAVRSGCLIEVPPGVQYCYSGRMRMLMISRPRWTPGNEVVVGRNPDLPTRFGVRYLVDRLVMRVRHVLAHVFDAARRKPTRLSTHTSTHDRSTEWPGQEEAHAWPASRA